jgi:hypothetical protein
MILETTPDHFVYETVKIKNLAIKKPTNRLLFIIKLDILDVKNELHQYLSDTSRVLKIQGCVRTIISLFGNFYGKSSCY